MRFVVDSSALAAIALKEPERQPFVRLLLDGEPVVSIASLTETYIVLRGRRGVGAMDELDLQLARFGAEIAPVTSADRPILRRALLDFGKGRGRPPAALNFGDLFAYALAKRLDLPLLFKGDDFARTDVRRFF